jgi:hypothetical protein
VSTKQSPLLKNWLNIGSVTFGVSGACALIFTQNLGHSVLIGLASLPGVTASAIVGSRQRQRQVHRQLERGRLRLNELQQRGAILNKQLELKGKNQQEIELRVAQLHSLAAKLSDRISLDRQQQQQLEQELATLTFHCQERQDFATNLDHKIQDKQATSLEVDVEISSLKLELTQIRAEQTNLTIHHDRAKISLTDIQLKTEECLAQLTINTEKLAETTLQLDTATSALAAKQIQLTENPTENNQSGSEDALSERLLQRELKIVQLELSSRQAELDNLDLKIRAKMRSIDAIDLEQSIQIFEPQPPIIDRSLDRIILSEAWCDKFIDNPHLTILQHIEKHGTITEAEASSKLGNARSVRQFANKIEEYVQDLPFSIRVESSPKGNRYLKEDQN